MAKRIFVIGMIMVLMCGFASAAATPAAEDAEAVQIYQTALNKMKQLVNYEMTVENTTDMQVQGGSSAVAGRSIRLQMNNQGQEAMQFLTTRLDTSGDQMTSSGAFYTEGKVYLNHGGSKSVQEISPTEALDYSNCSWSRLLPDVALLEDIYISATDEDGNVELTYACSKDLSNEMLNSETRNVNEYIGTVVINSEGYLVKATIWVDVETLTNEQLVKASTETIITFYNPGQTVVFELPSTEEY